jgi:3alpha(or 20beta)-hydroxysteroid dehydrogenase
MGRIQDKIALVTGAAQGLGASIAARFAAEGASVICADIRDDLGEEGSQGLRRNGLEARYVRLDVASPDDWDKAIASIREREGRLDVLVNNAGVNLRKGILDLSVAEWDSVIAINLRGALLGLKAAVPLIAEGSGGSVINIASISGLGASPNVAYGTSKWALRGLTRSAAFEFGPLGIRVNAILPGVVETPLNDGLTYVENFRRATPLGELASSDDIAAMALFLASEDSRAITGQDHVVDGGFSSGHRPELDFTKRDGRKR